MIHGDEGIPWCAHLTVQQVQQVLNIYLSRDWIGKYEGKSEVLLQPRSVSEVSAILQHCNTRKLAVVPQVSSNSAAFYSQSGCNIAQPCRKAWSHHVQTCLSMHPAEGHDKWPATYLFLLWQHIGW